jgi:hypothetical protein
MTTVQKSVWTLVMKYISVMKEDYIKKQSIGHVGEASTAAVYKSKKSSKEWELVPGQHIFP